MRKVLVVEDEASIRELIALNLQMAGWEVLEAENGERGLRRLKEEGPCDAAVLDVMLPGIDGFSLCESIRRDDQNIGIIILSAKGLEEDKIRGLSIGADDYMTKPFSAQELLARIRAMTRVSRGMDTNRLTMGNVMLDLTTYELSTPTGSFRLTGKEFQMMEMLLSNQRRLIPTERFLEKIWGYDTDAEVHVVWVYISYLRKKLASLGATVQIRVARNAGYSLEEIP